MYTPTFFTRTLRPLLTAGLMVVAGALASVAMAADDVWQRIKDTGVIRVGVGIDWPPYDGVDARNQPEGYDASVSRLLAEHLGVKLEFVAVTGPNRIPFLLTDKVDVIIASLAIIPERQEQVQFSRPYSAASIVLLGPASVNIDSSQDFLKYRIGVSRTSTLDIGVMKVAPEGFTPRRFDDEASALQAMLVGQVDAAGTSSAIAADIQKRYPGKYKVVYVINSQVMAIAMQKNRPELLAAMNEFVTTHLANGKLSTLFEQWLGTPLPEAVTHYAQ